MGAQGSELACLLRRLSSRIKNTSNSGPIFIGASATIVSDNSQNLNRQVAEYATAFFGSALRENDIFTGELEENSFSGEENNHQIPAEDPGINVEGDDETYLKILESVCPSESLPSTVPQDLEEKRLLLGTLLKKNSLFRKLTQKLRRPRALKEIEEELKEENQNYNDKEILRVLTLATKAYDPSMRDTSMKTPLVRSQVHFVARTIDGVYKCTKCELLHFSPRFNCPSCHGSAEALGVCRSCGAEFLRVELPESEYRRYIERDAEDIDRALRDNTPWTIRRATIMREPYGFSDNSVWISESEIPSDRTSNAIKVQRCTSCGSLRYNNQVACCSEENLKNVWLFKKISSCPFCLDQRGPYASPVSTIYLSPRTAAPTLFALTHTAIKDVSHRKQLIFSDSRQETARLAGFMDDLHRGILVRNLIFQAVSEAAISNEKVTFLDLIRITTEKFFGLNYKPDDEDDIFGVDRHRLDRQIKEELAGCFNKRYGVEKVGLLKTYYDILDSQTFIEQYNQDSIHNLKKIKDLTNASAEIVRDALAAILDHMRHEGSVKCLREFRPWGTRPAAFVERSGSQRSSLYFSVSGIMRTQRRSGSGFYNHTAFTKFVEKTFDIDGPATQNEIMGCFFRYLQSARLLSEQELGQSRRSGHRGQGWMVDESRVSYGLAENVGVCKRCGEKSPRISENVSCFTYKCNESEIESIGANQIMSEDDIYIKRYIEQNSVRMITAEDHGGLDDNFRKKIETQFKQGQIDVICCTPTLELGVDIGDLSIVGLFKSPPSPANYIQRVGRAGRREKISLAISFLGQNPIDQYYRRRPQELIGGNVRLPYVNLENDTVITRHVNSLIFETLSVINPRIQINKKVLDFRNSQQERELAGVLNQNKDEVKQKIKQTFHGIPMLADWRIDRICDNFPNEVSDAINKWGARRELLITTMRALTDQILSSNIAGDAEKADEYGRRLREIQRQLNEMQGEDRGESDLYSYLSGMGVLPTYTFPAKLVRIQDRWGRDLGNDRPACIAITEFAPGLNVDMRKKKYRVRGFDISTNPEPSGRTFFLCDSTKGGCGRYLNETHPGTCPTCHSPAARITEVRAWNPNSLVLDQEERISVRGDDEFKVADSEYFLLHPTAQQQARETQINTSWAGLRDKGASDIILLVRKTSDMHDKSGFDICPECGWCLQGEPVEQSATAAHNKLLDRRTACQGRLEKKSLWHKFRTNALELIPNQNLMRGDVNSWLISLKNALCRTAEIMINAAEGELNGFVLNNSLVIFDNVDGGVGYTRQVINRIHQIEREMALTILSCDCETGCPKCIYSSRRKIDIIRGNVDKTLLIPLCQFILRNSAPPRQLPPAQYRSETQLENFGGGNVRGNVSCWFSVTEDKRPGTWLRDLILMAKEEICATSLYVTDDKLDWEDSGSGSFVELFGLAVARGLKVRIIVRPPSSDKHRKSIRRMQEMGVEVKVFSRPSENGMSAIAHCKLVVVDGHQLIDTSAGVTLSANLSKEVQKNVDFFCLGFERSWISGIQHAFERIWEESRQF